MTVEAVLKGNAEWKKLRDIPQPPKELEKFL